MIGDSGTLSFAWDKLQRLRVMTSPATCETIPEGGFDAAGNLLTKVRRDIRGEVTCHYAYDRLYQLTAETGFATHDYRYDSLHNRLSKDSYSCDLDWLNQLIRQGDKTFSYDLRGNRIRSTDSNGLTQYAYDALGRLTEVIKDTERFVYSYDAFNRRLSKTSYLLANDCWIENCSERYLYQGQMEIGTVDADGSLTHFRALGKGLGAEIAAAIAIEIQGKAYAPIHDFSGHVMALLDPANGSVVEAYRHGAFGDEACFDATGNIEPLNPWRFASKRVDPETHLIHFGRRYYDPETGRWLTPDPIGYEDGPNLYAYVHNSPLTHFDLYGLEDLYDRNRAGCSAGRCESTAGARGIKAPDFNAYWLGYRSGCATWEGQPGRGYFVSGLLGTTHACCDYVIDIGQSAHSSLCHMGYDDVDDGARCDVFAGIHHNYTLQSAAFGDWYQSTCGVNPSDLIYQYSRGNMKTGLVVATAATGAYGAGRGLLNIARSWKAATSTTLLVNVPKAPVELNRFHANMQKASQTMNDNVRVLRGWAKSKGWEKLPNPQGGPEMWGLRIGDKFQWHLKIKSEPSSHLGLKEGSYVPRFDARLKVTDGGECYINPFSGEIGDRSIGRHIALDVAWWAY